MKGMTSHRPFFQPNRNNKSFLKPSYDGSIGSGIISPALSASGSTTTVTPITPMTPLTTPRTPLQILLGRQYVGVGVGPYNRRPSIPQLQDQGSGLSDNENEDQYSEKQLLALQLLSNFLNNVETTLNDITERENSGHQVLGPGIVRVCRDLADEIEGVARDLQKEHMQASEHLEQVRNDHELSLIEEGGDYSRNEEKSYHEAMVSTNEATSLLASFTNSESTSSLQSHEEFISTLSTTHTLLLDMAAALRAITQQEAQELGEVALEVARMFVWSLGMVHSNMVQTTLANDLRSMDLNERPQREESTQKAVGGTKQNRVTWVSEPSNNRELGPVVEILGEEEKRDEHVFNHPGSPTNNAAQLRYTPKLSPIPSSPPKDLTPISPTNMGNMHKLQGRVRVLWPPLLPAVTEAGKHVASNAMEHPIPAIAIGLTCGPAAIATAAFAGPPLLVADWAIQSSYNALSEHTPVIENVEKGAANAMQVAHLAILCSKLVVKQGIAVGERQIERRGGVGKVCSDVAGGAVDMALHPVETACKAWDGLFWIGGAAQNAVGFVKDALGGGELGMDIH